MLSTRQQFDPWLRDVLQPRYPELVAPLVAAIEALDLYRSGTPLTEKLLQPIVAAASSSRRPLYENATSFLGSITETQSLAIEAVVKMSKSKDATLRFNAILCLKECTPSDVTLQILRQALIDKSSRVRKKAADWAGRLRLKTLVPELESAAAIEQHTGTRTTILFELRLLRDGYILDPAAPNGFYVTTRTKGGVASRFVSSSELESRGLSEVVRTLANNG
jgi:hypothetical protein